MIQHTYNMLSCTTEHCRGLLEVSSDSRGFLAMLSDAHSGHDLYDQVWFCLKPQ